jgi:hypothetical protein
MYFLDNKYYSFKHHVTSLSTVMAVQEDSEDTSEDEDEDDAGHDTGSSSDGEATNSHNSDEEDT